jgi:hypothetical protein
MLDINIKITDSEDVTNIEEASRKLSSWDGELLNPDITCDVVLKVFNNMLQGMGYHKDSILNSMYDILEEEEYDFSEDDYFENFSEEE